MIRLKTTDRSGLRDGPLILKYETSAHVYEIMYSLDGARRLFVDGFVVGELPATSATRRFLAADEQVREDILAARRDQAEGRGLTARERLQAVRGRLETINRRPARKGR